MDKELDRTLARLCLLREAGGESLTTKTAVYHVILNRVSDPHNRWPKTIHQVITQPYQFSSFNANDPNVVRWPDERKTVEWMAWLDCGIVVDNSSLVADPTMGAQYYQDVSIPPPAVAWLGPGKTPDDLLKYKTIALGKLVFYNIPSVSAG